MDQILGPSYDYFMSAKVVILTSVVYNPAILEFYV